MFKDEMEYLYNAGVSPRKLSKLKWQRILWHLEHEDTDIAYAIYSQGASNCALCYKHKKRCDRCPLDGNCYSTQIHKLIRQYFSFYDMLDDEDDDTVIRKVLIEFVAIYIREHLSVL